MRHAGFYLVLLLLLGCASKPVPLLKGFTAEGTPVCLDDSTGIPAVVEKFYATRDLTTEEGKIDYLLERIRDSNLVFIRNRVEFRGAPAANFLRWKLNRFRSRYHITITTAQAFINEIVKGSKTSGEPYVVVMSDGSRSNLQKVLQNELDVLETCLKQLPAEVKQRPSGKETTPTATAASSRIHSSGTAVAR